MGFDISPLHLHNGKLPFQGKRLLWTSAAATAAGDNVDANDNGGGRSASAGRKAGKLQTGHQNTPVSPVSIRTISHNCLHISPPTCDGDLFVVNISFLQSGHCWHRLSPFLVDQGPTRNKLATWLDKGNATTKQKNLPRSHHANLLEGKQTRRERTKVGHTRNARWEVDPHSQALLVYANTSVGP